MSNFNPRSREGSDFSFEGFFLKGNEFQSTLPRRERQDPVSLYLLKLVFQSTLPRRERRTPSPRIAVLTPYFNPRSREGSDCHRVFYNSCASCISIHAPAKGATAFLISSCYNSFNFNPRSREGSDAGYIYKQYDVSDFNPRSREGSD